jgi:GT2 family glycosyltransferase
MFNIVFIVTNYNNSKYTESMIKSLELVKGLTFTFVVVDNASCVKELEKLDQLSVGSNHALVVLKSKENVGYFEGLNIGIRYARAELPLVDYYVIGNNDLEFPEAFASQLQDNQKILDKYPVVSPNIKMLDGTPQNPHVISAISKKREFIYDLYHSSYIMAGVIVRVAKLTQRFTDRKDEQQHAVAQEIYQGYGACYILGPKFFEHFSELDSPTFLMYEEFFLAKQLEEKGFKTYYEPEIQVMHHCHASTGTLPGKFRWQLSKNAHKEYRKYIKFWR